MNIRLPGVRQIFALKKENMPHYAEYYAAAGIKVLLTAEPREIAFTGNPELSFQRKAEENGVSEEMALNFRTMRQEDAEEAEAFAVRLVSGDCYLLGTREMRPSVDCSMLAAPPGEGANVFSYSARYQAAQALIPCLIPLP